ncbi:MAG TPA: 5-deoxy-glucuronate isomerase [Candidatus Latescibacteria bacterium]|nr:5-deoxy-glucuronate isomerase [Candidatus Latescibacterota bacterium]
MPETQTDFHIRKTLLHGENVIVPANHPSLELLRFSLLCLNEKESHSFCLDEEEAALVILTGTASIRVNDSVFERIGGRRDVFSGNAATVYAPCHSKIVVDCAGPGPLSLAVCCSKSTLRREPALIAPQDVKTKTVGRANWTRHVKDIIDVSFDAGHIVVGETINPPGNWSSSPPHRHEVDNPPDEVKMEEIYFFQLKPQQGFGFQRIYTDDRSLDVSYAVEHNSTVVLPKGYHPVAAAPGYQLYYLWFMAGPTSRTLCPKDDPAHSWLKAAEPIIDGLK